MENKDTLTLGSLFSGSGGFELGGMLAGITPKFNSEIEPFPIRVTTKRMPFVKHYGDVSKMDGAKTEPVDIITFGSPCFPAGTLVLTVDGYIPIEDIQIGDKVLTHTGKWQTVIATGNNVSETVVLKGNHYGLECTPNHPVYSANSFTDYRRGDDNKYINGHLQLSDKREWTPAEDMKGRLWATPRKTDPLEFDTDCGFEQNEAFWYLTGRWLGDGWQNRSFTQVYICDGFDDADELINAVAAVTNKYTVQTLRTGIRVIINSEVYSKWLYRNFGKYSYGKFIKPWVYGIDENLRRAFLKGILDTDGNTIPDGYNIVTVSESLALSLRILGELEGWSTRIHINKLHGKKTFIEGREVNQRDWYAVRFSTNTAERKRVHLRDDLHSWYRVHSVEHTGEKQTVYNLTVANDNSYVAGSIVVHNCQDMSIAGKRAGLNGSRSNLFFEAIRIIKEMREVTNGKYPRYGVWENVCGALSSNKGNDFRAVLEAFCSVKGNKIDIPRPEKWTNAGEILADNFSLAWRVLDAQYWGTAQRRKRIFLVADFGGQSAGKILFESEGVSGYSAESFRTWQRAAGSSEKSSGASSVCLNDQGGNRMDVTQDITATLRAEAHHPPCVMSAGFRSENSAKARSIGYEEEKSPTLAAGAVPVAVTMNERQYAATVSEDVANTLTGTDYKGTQCVFENHGRDTRYKGPLDVSPTISAILGTGGNNQPFVVKKDCFDVRFTSEGTKNARHNVYETDTARTIDTGGNAPDMNQGGVAVVERHLVVGGAHDPYREETITPTVDTNGARPICNQVGVAVVESYSIQGSAIGRDDKNGPQGSGINKDVSFTLNTTDRHAVYAIDRSAYNQGKNARYDISITDDETAQTVVARGPGAVAVEPVYTVRRLTPTECGRLQGFCDEWIKNLETENPTEDDLKFWRGVFDEYARINGTKPKSDNQIIKWLKNPYSDSAVYKMYGNGVALPCVYFVLAGIAYYADVV